MIPYCPQHAIRRRRTPRTREGATGRRHPGTRVRNPHELTPIELYTNCTRTVRAPRVLQRRFRLKNPPRLPEEPADEAASLAPAPLAPFTTMPAAAGAAAACVATLERGLALGGWLPPALGSGLSPLLSGTWTEGGGGPRGRGPNGTASGERPRGAGCARAPLDISPAVSVGTGTSACASSSRAGAAGGGGGGGGGGCDGLDGFGDLSGGGGGGGGG